MVTYCDEPIRDDTGGYDLCGLAPNHEGRCIPRQVRSFSDLLTDKEIEVIRKAGELWTLMNEALPKDETRHQDDLNELVQHIHAIQRAFMSIGVARAYPEFFRAFGSNVRPNMDTSESLQFSQKVIDEVMGTPGRRTLLGHLAERQGRTDGVRGEGE